MKVKLNKYLRDIGINEENYWILNEKVEGDPNYEEDEDGFIKAESFCLNTTLAMINYSYLCYFREHCLRGYPLNLTFEEWKKYIDKMIEAFKLIITEEKDEERDIKKLTKEEFKVQLKKRQRKINSGLRLYAKYFNHLWW